MPDRQTSHLIRVNNLLKVRCSSCLHARSWHLRDGPCACKRCSCKSFKLPAEKAVPPQT